MTDDDKALVERLFAMADEYDSGHHESWPTIDALEIAAHRIEALSAEVERRTLDGIHTCHDECQRVACVLRRENKRLREVLRDIQIEAERERGNWTHLKQVIARKARAALGETK